MKFVVANLDWIVPSLVALVALGFAWWSAASAHSAKRWAMRSAEAAEQSAQADVEQAAMMRIDREAAEKQLRQRPWELSEAGKDKYRYINRGQTAYNVELEVDAVKWWTQPEDLGVVANGEGFMLTVISSWTKHSGEVCVMWAESEGQLADRFTQRDYP